MSQCFPTPLCHKESIKVEIDLSNYATKKSLQIKQNILLMIMI